MHPRTSILKSDRPETVTGFIQRHAKTIMPSTKMSPQTSPAHQPERASLDGRPSIDLGARASLESRRVFYRAASSGSDASAKIESATDAQVQARKAMMSTFMGLFRWS